MTTDTLIITENDLLKTICVDYDLFKKKMCGYKVLGGTETYIVDQIEFFDMPVIDGDIDWNFWKPTRLRRKFRYYNPVFTGHKADRSWSYKLKFQNFGIPVCLTEIKNIKSNIQWADSLPVQFKSYEYLKDIYIKVSTPVNPAELKFKSKFIFEDSLKKKYTYLIEGNNSWYTIIRN